MNAKDMVAKMMKLVFAVLLPVALTSCKFVEEDMDDCGIYLEFVYDYNMNFSDLFDPQVGSVDVFVFDSQERYLLTRHSTREELIGGNRMLLENLPIGQCKIFTVAGLYEQFTVSDNGGSLTPGVTLLENVQMSLNRNPGPVSVDFSSIWIGKSITVDNKSDLSVHKVSLIKDTNRFRLTLIKNGGNEGENPETAPYTFELITPEGAVYDDQNMPLVQETVTYTPHKLVPGELPDHLSVGQINTMRLLYGEQYDYKLKVVDTATGGTVWTYNFMKLLEKTKPTPNSSMSMQEYLDRQSEWDMEITFKQEQEGFVALSVKVNNWLVWFHDIDF